MFTKPKYKICRRLGAGVYEKCQTQKFVASDAKKARSSKKRPKALSSFGLQLIEKQKVRFSYGVTEKQLQKYVDEAIKTKGITTIDKLNELLETRLDNVIYRLGFANSRRFSRQLASHGHFTVNGVKSTIPSYRVRVGDIIAVREGSKNSPVFADFAKKVKGYTWPTWLKLSPDTLSAEVVGMPKNEEQFLQYETVLEFYSR